MSDLSEHPAYPTWVAWGIERLSMLANGESGDEK